MTITAFPLQHGAVTFGQEPVYQLFDQLFGSGIVNGLTVAQRGAGANMSVDVASGAAYVTVSSGGKRMFLSNATSNSGVPGAPGADWSATFTAAHASLPRIDRVVAMVRDNLFDASGFYEGKLRVVAGTASSGASLANLTGAAAVPTNCRHVAYVLVPAAATTIVTANILNDTNRARIGAGTANGPAMLLPASATSIGSVVTAPYDGQVVHFQTAAMLADGIMWTFRYNAAGGTHKWESIGSPPITKYAATAATGLTSYAAPQSGSVPTIAIPLAGEYGIDISGILTNTTALAQSYMSPSGAGLAASDTFAANYPVPSAGNSAAITRKLAPSHIGALSVGNLTMQTRVSGGTGTFAHTVIAAAPIRVS